MCKYTLTAEWMCVVCRTAFGYHAGPTVNISFFIITKTMKEWNRKRAKKTSKETPLIKCTMHVINVNALQYSVLNTHIHFIDVSYRFVSAVLFYHSRGNGKYWTQWEWMNGGREHKDYISCHISINHIDFESVRIIFDHLSRCVQGCVWLTIFYTNMYLKVSFTFWNSSKVIKENINCMHNVFVYHSKKLCISRNIEMLKFKISIFCSTKSKTP